MTSEFAIAVHALVYLNHKAKLLTSEELAENICTNPVRVRKILAKLKKSELINTKEGIDGGYSFVLDANKVTLRQISQAVNARFVDTAWRSGDMSMDCLIASGMANIMDGIYDDLNEQCNDHLNKITINDIDKIIFKKE